MIYLQLSYHPMSDQWDLLAAALAGRYAIEAELGTGGMATVYLAEDLKHDRKVALKVLRSDITAAIGRDRFLREIQIIAQLNHPHILPLYDSGEVEGLLLYVMPYIPGESLRDRIKRLKHLPAEDALQVTEDIADALSYAHSRGVVHRDIKPGNILLEAGHAMVADFGIALAVSAAGGERITETGVYLGTPEYMSPEQAAGDTEIDGRSDQYSLACVLYEMLTGQPPFVAPTARAVIARHLTDTVPPIKTVRPDLPPAVTHAVGRALSKLPVDRYPTVDQFVADLSAEYDEEEAAERSIAVLAFANMSADAENEYLSDGLSDEIISALTKVEGFQVASRTSSFAFKGTNEDIRLIGKKLNVRSVLEGSVRRAGDRLRVTAQLISAEDGYHLWSEQYDREMKDVFAIQDEIAENVAAALRVVLSEEDKKAIQAAQPKDVEAYDYYLRGRKYFYQFREKSMQAAIQLFVRAIEVDPEYALAYAGIADSCSFLYMYFDSSEANLKQADEASRKAGELDPELAEAHAARGLAVSLIGRFEEAEEEFETAIRINPKLFEAYYFYARTCFRQGKLEQAVRLFRKATEVREDYQARLLGALAVAGLGDDESARTAYVKALEVIERQLELNPDDTRALSLGSGCLARLGEREKSIQWAGRAVAIDPTDAVILYAVACVYAIVGLRDEAIAYLDGAVRAGFGNFGWIENDPDLDSIRDDPRYMAILKRT
ncbi:MAG: protein kinase [Gemmatimonadota bacterium]|nr:MAG: protein kinase [Gemmatimonadota bacterium]